MPGDEVIEHDQVCFGVWRDDTDVLVAERGTAVARGGEESLVHGHGVVGEEGALVLHGFVVEAAQSLEPKPRLAEEVRRVSEVG